MQVGCSLVRPEDIPLAGIIGFDYVELMGKYLVALDNKEFALLIKALRESGLACKGINGYCPENIIIAGPGFDLKAARQYAKRVASRAKEAGVSYVGIGSPRSRMLPEGYSRKLAKMQVMDFLKVTAEEMGQYDITVCLEALAPCYCNFINYIAEAAGITQEIGWDSIRTVLDFYNMEHTGEADIDLLPWINEIVHGHISDDAGSPQKRYFLKTEKREIHQKRIRRLQNSGYTGSVTIEIDLPVNIGLAEESLKMLRDTV